MDKIAFGTARERHNRSVVDNDTRARRQTICFGAQDSLVYRKPMRRLTSVVPAFARSRAERRGAVFTSTFARVVLTLFIIGCGDEAESVEHKCQRVRDRLVALEVPLADRDREEHMRVMQRAMGNQFITHCTKQVPDSQRDCAIAATDSKAAFACLAGSHTRTGRGLGRSE